MSLGLGFTFVGAHMKTLRRKSFILSFSLLMSCARYEDNRRTQEENLDEIETSLREQEEALKEENTFVAPEENTGVVDTSLDSKSTTNVSETRAENIVSESPVVATADVAAPLSTPVKTYSPHEFLPGVHDVHPMLANYVGSYGVLPTRYAKDGPFLYSLPVNPKPFRDHDSDDI